MGIRSFLHSLIFNKLSSFFRKVFTSEKVDPKKVDSPIPLSNRKSNFYDNSGDPAYASRKKDKSSWHKGRKSFHKENNFQESGFSDSLDKPFVRRSSSSRLEEDVNNAPRGGNFQRPRDFQGPRDFSRGGNFYKSLNRSPKGASSERLEDNVNTAPLKYIKRSEFSESSDFVEESVASEQEVVLPEGDFEDFGLEDTLLRSLKKLKIVSPTKVQVSAIPRILQGENLICISQTGSGKTLAFLLPLLQKMLRKEVQQSLILSPTRELAIQIASVLSKFGTELGFGHALVIGGMDMREQRNVLRNYPEILVATPGRLLDMIRSGLVWLKYTDFVVLDEADRMLDMGFEKDLVDILKELPPHRQTLFFTATMLPAVEKIANTYVKNFERIQIDNPTSVADSIFHYLIPVSMEKSSKFELLKEVLQLHRGKIIVFFNTIRDTKLNFEHFRKMDSSLVTCIHSEKTQDARERSIRDFRTGKRKLLFATDVAARGIDVPDVELVINYDVPNNPEDYIHRIGRTGRGGSTGIAKMFYSSKDKRLLNAIEKILKRTIQEDTNVYENASKEAFSREKEVHPPKNFNRFRRKGPQQRRY